MEIRYDLSCFLCWHKLINRSELLSGTCAPLLAQARALVTKLVPTRHFKLLHVNNLPDVPFDTKSRIFIVIASKGKTKSQWLHNAPAKATPPCERSLTVVHDVHNAKVRT